MTGGAWRTALGGMSAAIAGATSNAANPILPSKIFFIASPFSFAFGRRRITCGVSVSLIWHTHCNANAPTMAVTRGTQPTEFERRPQLRWAHATPRGHAKALSEDAQGSEIANSFRSACRRIGRPLEDHAGAGKVLGCLHVARIERTAGEVVEMPRGAEIDVLILSAEDQIRPQELGDEILGAGAGEI